jgi:hypothetical protein
VVPRYRRVTAGPRVSPPSTLPTPDVGPGHEQARDTRPAITDPQTTASGHPALTLTHISPAKHTASLFARYLVPDTPTSATPTTTCRAVARARAGSTGDNFVINRGIEALKHRTTRQKTPLHRRALPISGDLCVEDHEHICAVLARPAALSCRRSDSRSVRGADRLFYAAVVRARQWWDWGARR